MLNIRIKEFYTKARESKPGVFTYGQDGKMVYDDWVAYHPAGAGDRSVVNASIKRLRKVDPNAESDDPAAIAARLRWEYISASYEQWKKGEELPVEGTPLIVAQFLTKEVQEVLKRNGVRTLEEFTELSETQREKMPIPRVRTLTEQVRRFLTASDQQKAHAEIERRDQLVTDLQSEVQALKDLLKRPADPAPQPVEFVEKRGPGRPPKPKQEEASA